MGLKFKPGDVVRQVTPVITGTVVDAVIVEGEVHYKVDWVGGDGEHRSRFFDESDIEPAPSAA